jgi:hypothetical protein
VNFWLARLPESRVSLISSAERPIKCTDSPYLGLDEQHIAFTQCEGPVRSGFCAPLQNSRADYSGVAVVKEPDAWAVPARSLALAS